MAEAGLYDAISYVKVASMEAWQRTLQYVVGQSKSSVGSKYSSLVEVNSELRKKRSDCCGKYFCGEPLIVAAVL